MKKALGEFCRSTKASLMMLAQVPLGNWAVPSESLFFMLGKIWTPLVCLFWDILGPGSTSIFVISCVVPLGESKDVRVYSVFAIMQLGQCHFHFYGWEIVFCGCVLWGTGVKHTKCLWVSEFKWELHWPSDTEGKGKNQSTSGFSAAA